MNISAGNIWSGAPNGLAVLTAPTELAFKKGALQHHYPVAIDGIVYEDAEKAYQSLKRMHSECLDESMRFTIMVRVLCHRFVQHPRVLGSVRSSGGEEFLNQCCHWPIGTHNRPNMWEGDAGKSGYVRALIEAYKLAIARIDPMPRKHE